MVLIDGDNTEKLQHDHTPLPTFMNLNISTYEMESSTAAFPGTPTDPAPSNPSNGANVIVSNSQRFSTPQVQTPTISGTDYAFFNYPTNIFQQPPSTSTLYGASPYSTSAYSEPSTPANGFPPTNFLSPYNAYAIPTPMDLNLFWPFNTAAVAIGSEITSDQAYQLATVGSSHSISNRLAPIHGVDVVPQPTFALHGMTRSSSQYGAGSQMKNGSNSRRGGGRRPREAEERNDLNDEDRDKRDKRRQRNKEAAARCRQRRIDLMSTLQDQLESYKQQNNEMDRAIQMLNQQKMQCINILQHHGCVVPKDLLEQPAFNINTYINDTGMHSKNHLQPLPPLLASPPQNSNKRRANQQPQHHQQRMPVVTMAEGMNGYDDMLDSVSPAPSSTYTSSSSSLITNNDPVISEAAVDGPKHKRVKEERASPLNESDHHVARTRPGTLPINSNIWTTLPSITTPSTGLIGFDTLSSNDYGLMNQQTGITPIVPQPQPVISSSGLQPPSESVLRQL
uniref:BZIP domain-containing protein n=2 Tax=Acrobeloides nanus TaxID=290746 RepID=A0A914DA77_9BILA